MARKDDLIAHVYRLVGVARSAHLKRALAEVEPKPGLNFWRLIYGNLLDVAVLEWCKLFGTDAEPTHWKKVIADHDTFRSGLLAALKIQETVWTAYWEEMKYYRDNRVSHNVEDVDLERWPRLDLALESSYYYYARLIKELRDLGETKYPDDLREYGERFAAQAIAIAKTALSSTSGITEKVH
jgi:hypothetical protein